MMIQGAKRKPKQCIACATVYTPKGNAAKFCEDCATFRTAVMARYHSKTRHARVGRNVGVGSGGANRHTSETATVSTYRKVFLTRLYINQKGLCFDCKGSFPESALLVHHIDHNRDNNKIDNLQLVCKRCHQIEHECWLAFRKV